MLPTSRTHPRLHGRNPQINFLIVTNHRYVLKDSDLFFSQHFKKIVRRFNGHTIERYNEITVTNTSIPRVRIWFTEKMKSTLHSSTSAAQSTLARLRLQKPYCRRCKTLTATSRLHSRARVHPNSVNGKACYFILYRGVCTVSSDHSPPEMQQRRRFTTARF